MRCPICRVKLHVTETDGWWCPNGCYSSEHEIWDDMQKKEKLLYIIGPYRAEKIIDVKRNIRRAEKVMEWAWTRGWVPICPHLNSAFIDGLVPDSTILRGYREVLRRCDAVTLVGYWQGSAGSVDEVNLAKELRLTFVERDDPCGL